MLELFLKLIEKLIALSKEKKSIDRRLFEDHIDPIYQNIQIIVDDYRSVFASIEEHIADDAVPLKAIIDNLKARRRKQERIRKEMSKYAWALYNSRYQDKGKVSKFSNACFNLLKKEPTMPDPVVGMTPLTSLLEELERYSELNKHEAISRDRLVELAARYSSGIDRRWQKVAQHYYELRTECLG